MECKGITAKAERHARERAEAERDDHVVTIKMLRAVLKDLIFLPPGHSKAEGGLDKRVQEALDRADRVGERVCIACGQFLHGGESNLCDECADAHQHEL
jgi:hypothetical protein